MIEGIDQWDAIKATWEMSVTLPFGDMLSWSPAYRAAVTYGAIIPATKRGKGTRGKKKKQGKNQEAGVAVETMAVEEALSEPMEEIFNFHTEGTIILQGRTHHVQNILVDSGPVVNLIPDVVARELNLPRSPGEGLYIKTDSGQELGIGYYTNLRLTIGGVTTKLKAYIIPMTPAYSLLLGRRWLKQVRAVENHEK